VGGYIGIEKCGTSVQMRMYPDFEALDVLALVRVAPPPLQDLQYFVDVYQRYYDDFRVATAP
jgi:hypothetical protein